MVHDMKRSCHLGLQRLFEMFLDKHSKYFVDYSTHCNFNVINPATVDLMLINFSSSSPL